MRVRMHAGARRVISFRFPFRLFGVPVVPEWIEGDAWKLWMTSSREIASRSRTWNVKQKGISLDSWFAIRDVLFTDDENGTTSFNGSFDIFQVWQNGQGKETILIMTMKAKKGKNYKSGTHSGLLLYTPWGSCEQDNRLRSPRDRRPQIMSINFTKIQKRDF